MIIVIARRSIRALGCYMSILREYEKTVVHLLTSSVLSPQQLNAVIREGKLVEYDYTGSGYFLTIKHADLPIVRIVCDTPKFTGSADGIISGFVIFIQDGELTIEC